MAESIKVFENSLRDYLVDVQSDAYNTTNKTRHKYNNLKVYMDPKKNGIPHFWVSVNISSACYTLEPLVKVAGSMGEDERFILLWASRPNIYGELKRHWAYINKSAELLNEQVQDEKTVEQNMEISKEAIKEAAESITGTGLKRKDVFKE